MHRHRRGDVQHMLGLARLVGDDAGLNRSNFCAEKPGNVHISQDLAACTRPAALGNDAGCQLEREGAGFVGNGQAIGLHRGQHLEFVVADVELLAGAAAQAQHRRHASGLATAVVVVHRQAFFKLGHIDRVTEAH